MFKDGAGATYDSSLTQFITNGFGYTDSVNGTKNANGAFEMFNFGTTTSFAQKADNSVAGEMRDCGECHVGGGMMEYVNNTIPSTDYSSGVSYDPAKRTPLRDYNFGSSVTAFNALVDIFNNYTTHRKDVIVQNYSQTGVLEMDCLMCHLQGYSWEARKEAVRKGEFDASRAAGAKLINGIKDGVTVFYNYTAVKTDASGNLYVNLGATLQAVPDSNNCASCHLSQYNVDWKKRGEQWLPGTDVHMGIGCMGCHERKDNFATVGTAGTINNQLGLCDPAKGGNSAFDALWNKLDTVNFKGCAGCHEPAATPTFSTFGAPNSVTAHTNAGLTQKIAFDKDGNAASHMDLIDCTACHIKKTFDGGAFVDGTGADAEGRVALHDEPQVARDMTNGNALYWDNGKLYAANLLTSFFVRDMNGMDTNADPANTTSNGLDVNNDGRNAGMDAFLQTHINNINNANGLKAVTMAQNSDGSWVNETEMGDHLTALAGGIKAQLGNTSAAPVLPKVSFLMVPFKASHNIATVANARGRLKADGSYGCDDCHSATGNFYNGTYPIKGNMDGYDNSGTNYKFRFKSDQVTAFTKVNGLVDVTDSHPNVVTKKGDRTVPVPMLTKFDNPYVAGTAAVSNQTLRNIDRSEVIYEPTFQTRDTGWYTYLTGTAPAAACSGPTSPFYCADPLKNASGESIKKSHATSTKGWLLKVEVRPAGDTNANNITFRTAQLGKDNAASMDEVLAALPLTFTSNPDFTVTASGGALTISAQSGKEIRISPQTDVGPFGLKGQLWKADPIVRATGTYATRDAYVAYLNSITSAVLTAAQANLAEISSIGGINVSAGVGNGTVTSADSTASDTMPANAQGAVRVNVYTGVPVALAANTTGNPATITYAWTVNDGYDPAHPGVQQTTTSSAGYTAVNDRPIANPAQAVFPFPGIYKVSLTTTNTFGDSKQDYQYISVTDKPVVLASTVTLSGSAAAFGAGNTLLANSGVNSSLPISGAAPAGTTMIKVAWGDGGYSQFTSADTTGAWNAFLNGGTLTHAYNRSYKGAVVKDVNGNTLGYQYTTQVFYYGGANNFSLLASQKFPVAVTPMAQVVPTVRVTKLKSNGVYNVAKGSTTTIVLTVTNKGPDQNSGILTIPVPSVAAAGLTLVANGNPSVGSFDGTNWSIPANLLKGKAFATLALTVTVPMSASSNITYTVPANDVTSASLNDATASIAQSAIIKPY